jgi:5-methylcytosine-specific restriction endonuclease McrA
MKISLLKKKLSKLVKDYVKKRDNYTCQKCDKKVSGTNCHASHVIPVSSGNVLAFDPLNMKVLCYHHHINWWHKNPIESGEWFKKKFPERWEYLNKKKNEEVHWKEFDYLEMIKKFKENL